MRTAYPKILSLRPPQERNIESTVSPCLHWVDLVFSIYDRPLGRPIESHSGARGNILARLPNIFTEPLWKNCLNFSFQNGTFWRTSYFWPMVRPPKQRGVRVAYPLTSLWCRCFPGLTMAPQLLPAFRNNSWAGFSLCRTPLRSWSLKLVVRTTFSHYCADYTGFGCQNGFRSSWQCWSIAASMALHLATWLQIFSASHLNAHRRLRSLTTSALVTPRTMRSTIADCTFPATAASVWNSLPESVRSLLSLQVFRSSLKTKLFARSYRHD